MDILRLIAIGCIVNCGLSIGYYSSIRKTG
ncbi:hypothetical protein CoNPh23_CDS0024 [Staphylococcus phage S-CoN_Ph23]|nr:hypothetical protein CoNPh18_CDS0082 [Staphylococcus phage S-CoN_Ph18]WNM54578.1 hypothetical protein CoNPh19_CDS0031 [Staphylococcus phage S-CoN_Ph19]WNM54699.1 hypothetical protein CoNPh20_CDS0073 [Staphylococcus phage S-CoN_Ph20]WNM54747.1 hypothetical protein CoNPh21_CDS0038 [Staphylococcus phage S-CoN_Ph21]WNM54814.1 hypothetical protein CoNPh22_CDS0030 [Staphylococcus phage S-CoN_Ph22]WNM54887.1 hypothetical protein CoNPh23_CDS0024 [Staphylococcus phage S-CoN_Ph23]